MKTPLLAWVLIATLTSAPDAVAAPSVAQEGAEALRSHPNLDNGAQLFLTCAACHGATGGGTVDGQIPRIAGQHYSVLVKQIVDYRGDRRWDQAFLISWKIQVRANIQ